MYLIGYHIRSALSYILKFRSHTAFSLLGLVIGLACVFIISAWSMEELLFDRFHRQADHIYMLTTDVKDNTGNVNRFPETPAPLAAALEMQIPQIEYGFHFLYLYGGREFGTGENTFKEKGIAATSEFLDVFNFPLVTGNRSDLDDPGSIFLSRSLADKIFPGGSPMGKELLYRDSMALIVRGIFKDVPLNSSIQFDFLIPYEIEYGISEEWWSLSDATFMKTSPGTDIEKLVPLVKDLWREKISDDQFNIGMIPVTELRYGANFEFFNAEHGHGNRRRLYMFLGVAAMILILACLNYMNLISAYALKREHELWIRKVHGASARNITNYYLIESVLLSVVAWGLAALLSLFGLRLFVKLMGIVISPHYFFLCTVFGLLAAIIIVGLATGFVPAIRAGAGLLERSNAAKKPNFRFQANLRNVIVLVQFVLSIALIVSSLIVMRQASFMREFDTGYKKQGIVEFNLPRDSQNGLQELKDWLSTNPAVEGFSVGGASPVNLTVLNTIEKWSWEGLEEGAHTSFYHLVVDEAYLNVFKMPMTSGRFFSSSGRDQNRIVINEKLADLIGMEDPVGGILRRGEEEYEIIGVVRDFNFQHLSSEIRPLVFTYAREGRQLFVSVRTDLEGTVDQIRDRIATLSDNPPGYSFIIEAYENLYRGERQILSAILVFTIISILLSALGLIGLVTQGTEAKTKDIAVRKVFGAETRQMMIVLNLNILKLFLPGMIIGSLLAGLIMHKWMMDYVYRKELNAWVFLIGSVIILVLALLSVCVQTWNAAKKSPAEALRNQ